MLHTLIVCFFFEAIKDFHGYYYSCLRINESLSEAEILRRECEIHKREYKFPPRVIVIPEHDLYMIVHFLFIADLEHDLEKRAAEDYRLTTKFVNGVEVVVRGNNYFQQNDFFL